MGRAKLLPGQLGTVGAKQVDKGNWKAWARFGTQNGTALIERTGRTKAIAIKVVEAAAKTRVEAERELEAAVAEAAIPTMNQLAEEYFRKVEPPKVQVDETGGKVSAAYETRLRRQTFDLYAATYRNHLSAALGSMKVTSVGQPGQGCQRRVRRPHPPPVDRARPARLREASGAGRSPRPPVLDAGRAQRVQLRRLGHGVRCRRPLAVPGDARIDRACNRRHPSGQPELRAVL